MSKTGKLVLWIVIVILVILGVIWYGRSAGTGGSTGDNMASSTTPVVPVSETTKVSDKLSEYQNSELGFSVNYPTAWERNERDLGVTFVVPIDRTQVSTVGTLKADIDISSAKCSFPPVTTVKDRGTLKVGTSTVLNTISMTNSVQGRSYFNRMYSLDKNGLCYMFSFSSITQSTSSKGLTGSNATQAENNNKAIISTADTAFTNMVKTFTFVTGPAGVDETKASPAK